MNKTAIKNFAVWARRKLIADITIKAGGLGITENGIAKALPQSTADLKFFDIGTKDYAEVSGVQVKQREALVRVIKEKERDSKSFKDAFEYVVEEVAYTWFNRLIAIRFMEVNDYLPSGIRVLSSENPSKNEPDFVTTPFETDLSFTPYEQDRVYQLKDENKWDELFRMLFIKQCNKLNEILPELFQKTEDYTELLLTISYSDTDGIIHHLVHDIDEKDFDIETIDEGTNKPIGQVEIIGWMYQYYNIEPKDKVFADLKKNIKIAKEHIPAATQLFTPDWIVRYMVENSLGRLWLEGHQNNDGIKSQWKYYLDEAEQEPEVIAELEKIREDYKNINPEDIKLIDPCMGSGHILVYAFDVLMQIYESYGYAQRDAAKAIVLNNIFGLDIDKRAYQLAYFAIMMKARQYNRRIFNEHLKPNLFAVNDSACLTEDVIDYISKGDKKIKADLESIRNDLFDAKEYGSLVDVTPVDFNAIYKNLSSRDLGQLSLFVESSLPSVEIILRQAEVMSQKYDVVITNPPYMGASGMGAKLSDFVKKKYPDSKSDLFAVFIEKGNTMLKPYGYNSMVTMQSWMFLSSFEEMRKNILRTKTITNLMHMENMVMGIAFGTAVTILKNINCKGYKGTYHHIKLSDIITGIPKEFPVKNNRFAQVNSSNFANIPGSPIAYWVNDNVIDIFAKYPIIDTIAKPRQGLATGDNNKMLRLWHEVDFNRAYFDSNCLEKLHSQPNKRYIPYNKGGSFRKWFGNIEYLIKFDKPSYDYLLTVGNHLPSRELYFKESITWSKVTSGGLSMRYVPLGSAFDVAGCSIFAKKNLKYILGLCNSNIMQLLISTLSQTMNYEVGTIKSMPVKIDEAHITEIESIVGECIVLSKADWDSFETSWDFKKSPLI